MLGAVSLTLLPGQMGRAATRILTDDELMARLMEDAKAAWSYFQIPGNAPAMAPGSAWVDEDGAIGQQQELTMWDVGSIILANVSARDLGLIDDADLKRRSKDVLAYLGKTIFTFKGSGLPNFSNNSKDGSPLEAGFDSTDMGRLLIALSVLDHATGGSLDIKKVVDGWDVQSTIKNGEMQDVKDGEMGPAESYVYTAYVSRGYNLWDIKHKPVLGAPVGTPAESRSFLDQVYQIGMISTEPSLNEAIELGITPQSALMADTLYDAQRQRFEETGILTAVSEGPTDREPWFTYQGYRRDGEDEEWRVDALDENPAWQTEAFVEDTLMVSSKAAFLWLAYRPDDYSRKLYDHISNRAKSEKLGFSSGIYEKSGERCEEYDVNTNAVILEAIAYIKNGRTPFAAA